MKNRTPSFLLAALVSGSAVLLACGGSDAAAPAGNDTAYTSDPNKTVVLGDGKGGTVSATPSGAGCIATSSGECVKPQDKCKQGERADVIVDSTGKLVDIVCYPATSTPTPVDGQGNVELGKDNKGVVSVDGADDGVDIAGDVSSSGNNVTVYGQGAGVSVIGGDVTATGNNFALRGVTVQKDVTITGNNATLVLCAIDGDVVIEGNNTVIAECTIRGKLTIKGNNSKLVSNNVAGGITVDGTNTVCDANLAWNDANTNGLLDPGESGAAIACSGADGGKKK
jgi:hypothetical protein